MNNPLKRNSLPSLVSAPIVWAVHFVVSYAIVSLACAGGYTEIRFAGVDAAKAGIGAVTLIALALMAYIGIVNHRKWRHALRQETGSDGMSRFFALSSVLLCGLSVVAVIWVALPIFLLPLCAA